MNTGSVFTYIQPFCLTRLYNYYRVTTITVVVTTITVVITTITVVVTTITVVALLLLLS